jgi:hypothetical protein
MTRAQVRLLNRLTARVDGLLALIRMETWT